MKPVLLFPLLLLLAFSAPAQNSIGNMHEVTNVNGSELVGIAVRGVTNYSVQISNMLHSLGTSTNLSVVVAGTNVVVQTNGNAYTVSATGGGGGSQVWTNHQGFIFPSGEPAPDAGGVLAGPSVFFRNDGSLFSGTNVNADINVADTSVLHFPYVANFIDSNNVPTISADWSVYNNNDDYSVDSDAAIRVFGDKDTGYGFFRIRSFLTNGASSSILFAVDPSATGFGGTQISVSTGLVTFAVSPDGLVSANGYTDSSLTASRVVLSDGSSPPRLVSASPTYAVPEAAHATNADLASFVGGTLSNSITGNALTATKSSFVDSIATNQIPGSGVTSAVANAAAAVTSTFVTTSPLSNHVWASNVDSGGQISAAVFPALTGDITTSAGSLATALKNTGTAGTYTKTTFDAQGRETSGTTLSAGDIPALAYIANNNGNGTNASLFGDGAPALTLSGGFLSTNETFGSIARQTNGTLQLSNANVTASALVSASNVFQIDTVPLKKSIEVSSNGNVYASGFASFRNSLEITNATSTESVFISNAVVTVIHTNLALQSTSFGLNLTNSNQAALNTQISSPGIAMYGNGWKTASTAGSQTVGFRQYVLPVQGSSSPSATWQLDSSINGGAFANALTYSSGGALTTAGGVTLSGSGGITTSDDINSGGSIRALSSGFIYWNSRSRMESTVDGNITLHNAANTAFTALILGPVSNTWPTFVAYTNALGANIDSTINHKVKSLIISSNALSSWPTAPIAPGDTAFVSSNGVVYALYSGVAATWVKTNLISGP